MREVSRRGLLAGTVPITFVLSGCSALAKAGAKSADEVGDAAKAARKADDVPDGAKAADDSASRADEADESKNAADTSKRAESLVERQIKREVKREAKDDAKESLFGEETTTSTPTPSFNLPIFDFGDRVSLEVGDFVYWELNTSTYTDAIAVTFEYEVFVHTGTATDVFLLEVGEFERYRRGEPFRYLTAPSRLGVTYDEVQTDVIATDYRLVIDNTVVGEASSADYAEVSINCTVTE